MIYFQHKQTKVIYKARTLRGKLTDHHCFMFDAIIASIVYGEIENVWSDTNIVIKFLDDYDVLIPNGNVFGKVADTVVETAE